MRIAHPVRDYRIPSVPRGAGGYSGIVAPGYTQMDAYSCGAVVVYTAMQLQRIAREQRLLPKSAYADVYKLVAPDPEMGAEWKQLRRGFPGRKSRYGKFRERSVVKSIREGAVVIAAIAWPTEEEPDLLHYVTLTAKSGTGELLALNLAGNPGKSWGWRPWEELRPGADDTTLVVQL